MKVDLHVHSKNSRRPSEWILKQLGCPESFTEPLDVYRIAKEKGMSLVTLTDHNTIEGCLEIAHLPDTFISEEVTTYFPEDRCKLHVLVYDIDETIHREIQEVRENVFDLTAYLTERRIVHALAHPLYSINRKLTPDHVERAVLLFQLFELNGARSEEQNQCLESVLGALTPETIDRLSEKHGIVPRFELPWQKGLFGGSDDHSSLCLARRYTEVDGVVDLAGFLRGIQDHHSRVVGQESTPQTLSRTIYSIAYQFYSKKFGLERYTREEVALRLLDGFLQSERVPGAPSWTWLSLFWTKHMGYGSPQTPSAEILTLLRDEARRLICEDPHVSDVANNGGGGKDLDQKWFRVVNDASNKVLRRFTHQVVESLVGGNLFNVFDSLGSAGALYFVLAPYFVSFSCYSEERRFGRSVARCFRTPAPGRGIPENIRVAHFTDTLHEVNGVAESLKTQIGAAKRLSKHYTVITCRPHDGANGEGIRYFEPIGVYELPVYPEQKLYYPPFLEMLDYCYRGDFTHIHAATPGPLGLAALAVARILKLPLIGTYHTALPQYARFLTEDADMEEVMWKYVIWFYDQMDSVFVPSQAFATELADRGLNPRKIRVFPRGVDVERFHPAKRNGVLDSMLDKPYTTKLVYVGRVSKEKNLSVLATAFRNLAASVEDVCLVVVGDGPYREEMERTLEGTPCVFTGYLEGELLSEIYASCDLLVFPSTTDTFGNVVLEAQASGLPALVTDLGGPQENIVPGETGVIIRGNDELGLRQCLQSLVADPEKLRTMGRSAREYAETRSFDSAFKEAWNMYSEVRSCS